MHRTLPYSNGSYPLGLEPRNNIVCVSMGETLGAIVKNLSAAGLIDANSNFTSISSAEYYFRSDVMHEVEDISNGLGLPDWRLSLCLLFAYLLIFFIMWKGVASSGKISYFLALFPYVVLFALLVRGLTLPGAADGIYYFIKPDWSALFKVDVWYNAVSQSFFSLIVGFGPLATFGSYNSFRHNVYRDVIIISVVDTFTSILAGFTIFAVLGNLAFELDKHIDEVVDSGTSLAFVTYPTAICKFDFGVQAFSVLFFMMMATLGLGSTTGWLSGLMGGIFDLKARQFNRPAVTGLVCLCLFALGNLYITPGGYHVLQMIDYFQGGFIIFIMTLLECVAVHYIYGIHNFMRDIRFMLNKNLNWFWRICWLVIIPLTLSLIVIFTLSTYNGVSYGNQSLPPILEKIGWTLSCLCLAQIPIWWFIAARSEEGNNFLEKAMAAIKCRPDYGPIDREYYNEWRLLAETERNSVELKKRKSEKAIMAEK